MNDRTAAAPDATPVTRYNDEGHETPNGYLVFYDDYEELLRQRNALQAKYDELVSDVRRLGAAIQPEHPMTFANAQRDEALRIEDWEIKALDIAHLDAEIAAKNKGEYADAEWHQARRKAIFAEISRRKAALERKDDAEPS